MKRSKIGLWCWLLWAGVSPCWGGTYYLSSTGNDTTGDGSEALPWATFGKCVALGAGDHVVYVKPGTYDQEASGLLTLTNAGAWTTLAFKGYLATPGDGDSAEIATGSRPVLSVSRLYANTADAGVPTVSFQNINITSSATNAATLDWNSANGYLGLNLFCKWCTITTAATSGTTIFNAYIAQDATATRTLTFQSCTFAGLTDKNLTAIRVRGFSSASITGCVFNGGTGALQSSQALVAMQGYLGSLNFSNNTVVTRGYVVYCLPAANDPWGYSQLICNNNTITSSGYGIVWDQRDAGNTWTAPKELPVYVELIGNTVTTDSYGLVVGNGYRDGVAPTVDSAPEVYFVGNITGNRVTVTGASGHGILIGPQCVSAEVAYNTISTTSPFGIVIKGSSYVHHNAVAGPEAVYLLGGIGCRIEHNSIYATGGAGHYAVKWGANDNENYASASGTAAGGLGATSSGTAVTFGGDVDLDHVQVGDVFKAIGATSGIDGGPYFDIVAFSDASNTVTLAQAPAADFSNVSWAIYTQRPQRCSLTHNVIDAGTGEFALYGKDGSSHALYSDHNLIVGHAWINATDCDTAAELRAAWAAWSGARSNNDASTLVTASSPFLSVDPSSSLFLKATGGLWEGTRTNAASLSDWQDKGAWDRRGRKAARR